MPASKKTTQVRPLASVSQRFPYGMKGGAEPSHLPVQQPRVGLLSFSVLSLSEAVDFTWLACICETHEYSGLLITQEAFTGTEGL